MTDSNDLQGGHQLRCRVPLLWTFTSPQSAIGVNQLAIVNLAYNFQRPLVLADVVRKDIDAAMLDKIDGIIIVAALLGVPAWLVLRAWRRYSALEPVPARELLQMRIGLILLSITLCMWFTLFLIFLCSAVFPGNSKIVVMLDPIVSQVSLPGIGLINLLICVGGIVCSRFRRKSAEGSLPLRKAIGLASGCMLVPWLLMMSNPH